MPINTAIILAAGPGQRIWPYNEVRNKCTTPVGNLPNIRRIANDLVSAGLSQSVVVVGVNPGSVRAALFGGPLQTVYVNQAQPTGTADAAVLGLSQTDAEAVLLIYGDIVTSPATIQRALDCWNQGDHAAVALVERIVLPRHANDWIGGYVEDGLLKSIEGHSTSAPYRLGGLFVFDRRLLPYLVATPDVMVAVPIGGMPAAERELAQALQRFIADGNPIAAIEPIDYLVDMDKPWHILEANHHVLRATTAALHEHTIHPSARIHDGAEIQGFVELGPGSKIGNRVVLGGNTIIGAQTQVINGAILKGSVLIGHECRISDYCLIEDNTVIGNRCIVGHGAEMSGVQFDGSYLWHYCEIYGIVGQAVDIGAATVCGTLRFDDGPTPHRVRGRRELPESGSNATYFGDFSRTGVNVITQPGAKIGAYACVGAGIVVYEDVPSRTLRLLKQETIDRPWGPERYGW